MEIIIGTAASVATTIITVLGAIFYLDRKIDTTRHELDTTRRELSAKMETDRRELSAEIKEVRQASQDAHIAIREDLSDIKAQYAAHNERLKCIESHLNVSRPEE